MSSRPRRSCTLPVAKPNLSEILAATSKSSDTENYNMFKTVCKYYKKKPERMARFWFKDTDGYDLTNREHLQLLSRVFETIGTKDLLAIDYLHSMTKEEVRACGLQRVVIPNHIFYRVRTGMGTASTSKFDYDDYYKASDYHTSFYAK